MIDYQKDMTQDSKTKNFLKEAKHLVESGKEPSYKAIADKIGWHNNSLSLALKGKRNVPFDIYKKFAEIYKLDAPENKKTTTVEDDSFKDKYITLLEDSLRENKATLEEVKRNLAQMPLDMIALTTKMMEVQNQLTEELKARQQSIHQDILDLKRSLVTSSKKLSPGQKH
jgi:transcriptional regulator with XRE-family HTH domain